MVYNCYPTTWVTEFWNGVDSISDEGSSLVIGDPIQQTYNPVKIEQPD